MLAGDVCMKSRPINARTHFSLNAGLNVSRVYDGRGEQLDFGGRSNSRVDGDPFSRARRGSGYTFNNPLKFNAVRVQGVQAYRH
jgi:hypothetical protein